MASSLTLLPITASIVDQYNGDARLWRKLAPARRARRKVLRRLLSRKRLKELDLLEFTRERPPQDCIGLELDGVSASALFASLR